ncbi:uncharacterized protein LOC121755205 [Salvia splendens]|uniref:uncharacterized protein LOC121755205 n=1 Tax=Salvia splendens TaxID=180675 RepID=UPI001C281408|nr:uncharacterized protein LOC121755205 [Salvia splendens]
MNPNPSQESAIGFLNSIPVLKGNTYASWRSKVLIGLGIANLDYALRTEQPAPLTDESSDEDKRNFERWEHSNRMSLMIMQHAIPENFRGTVPKEATAKEFLEAIDMNFASNEKAETASLMHKLVTMRYNGRGEIREHIMEMSNTASKLTALNLTISDDQLVHLVMISLPHQFDHFKVSYNTVKDKWSLNELISHCVQEEERLKQSKTESAHLATSYRGKRGKDKGKRILSEFAKGKRILPDSSRNVAGPSAKQFKKERSGSVCFFCKKDGHKKNDCEEYHAWRVKKGLPPVPKAD